MDTPNCDHGKLLTKCDIHTAYVGNGLCAGLRPIKHSVPVPPASESDLCKVTPDADVDASNSGTTSTNPTGTTVLDESPHEDRPRGDGDNTESATSEPILAGTTSDNNQVSTKSEFTVNDLAMTSNAQVNRPGTTTESGELNLLPGTTVNAELSNADTL